MSGRIVLVCVIAAIIIWFVFEVINTKVPEDSYKKEGDGMREIKFRGKRVDNREWVYGCLIYDNAQTRIVTDLTQYNSKYCDCKSVEVIPETVGQYLGIDDDYHKKLFEGDIAKMFFTKWITIEFKIEFGMLLLCSDELEDGFTFANDYIQNDRNYAWLDCEIISSIHDNPELLEVK
jgi:uncharacterized phage protein (TIGR01671 family)